jgi:DNA-directed RNA polymerase specialized sigma24 family protein
MSLFFISGQESQQAREDALLQQPEPLNFWDNPLEGTRRDLGAAFARSAEGSNRFAVTAGRWLGNGGLSGNPRAVAALSTPQDTDWERYFSSNADDWARVRRNYTVDPATRSESANLIGGLTGSLATFVSGSLTGGPVVGAVTSGYGFGAESEERLLEQGADPATAAMGGTIEGGFMGAMGFAPASLTGNLWRRALTGAGINLGFGFAQRGSMNAYLTESGYGAGDENDLASQYRWMDPQAATIDAVLGATFGAAFGQRAQVRPHRSGPSGPDVAEDAPAQPLPSSADGYFEEARQYGNDEQYAEAYAYALIARDMGHPEADGLIQMIEEDASFADIDEGTSLANQIARDHISNVVRDSGAVEAALIEADTIRRETAFGIPENQASRRWASDSLARMEEQAARDEPIDPGPVPEGTPFVQDSAFEGAANADILYRIERALDENSDVPLANFGMLPEEVSNLERRGIAVNGRITSEGLSELYRQREAYLADRRAGRTGSVSFIPLPTAADAARARFIAYVNETNARLSEISGKLANHIEDQAERAALEAEQQAILDRRESLTKEAIEARTETQMQRAIEAHLLEQGLDAREVESRLQELRDSRPEMFDEDGAPRFSMGRRGLGEERGNERFYDERLSETQNKAVEMARNGYSNEEIADELDASSSTVRVHLSQARKRAPDIEIPSGKTGVPRGVNPRTGERTATIEEIVRLYNKLSLQGYTNRQGNPAPGHRNINTIISERLGVSPNSVAKRLLEYRRDLAEGRVQGEPLFSVGEGNGFSSPDELRAAAREMLGADWDALARAGKVELVQSSADVPAGMYGLPRGVQAVHMPSERVTYFIANNVRPEDMRALILHEIGVHHGFEQMIGKRGFKEVLRQIDRMVEEDHPLLTLPRSLAERYSARESHIPEETLAYLIETQADLPLVNSLLSKLRQWLIKTFGSTFGMRLTVEDLRALAITSLRRVAEQARREAGDPVIVEDTLLFSRQGPDAGGVQPSQLPDGGSARAGSVTPGEWVDAYHGTTNRFDDYDLGRAGVTGYGEKGRAIWFGATPREATFGSHRTWDPAINPPTRGAHVRPEQVRMTKPLVIDAGGAGFDAIPTSDIPGWQQYERKLGYTQATAHNEALVTFARSRGYDGIVINNVGDIGSGYEPGTVYGVLNTANIRSRLGRAQPNAGGDFPKFSFGGRRAKTANEDHLTLARALEREGKDEWAIWHNTGWARGVDGKWRFEIPDDGADFGVPWSNLRRRKGDTPLEQAFNHPELFEAYPILRDVSVRVVEEEGVGGTWDAEAGVIEISPKSSAAAARRTMLHEIQHAIQDIEEFAPGIDWKAITNRQRMQRVRDAAAARIEKYYWVSEEGRKKWISEIDARMETYRLASGEAEARANENRRDRGIPPAEAVRNEVLDPSLLWNPRRRNWEVFRGRQASEAPTPRQNRDNLLGAKRDPIESPDYQRQLDRIRSRGQEGRAGEASGRPGEVGGVRGDAATGGRRAGDASRSEQEQARSLIRETLDVSGIRIVQSPVRKSGLGMGAYRAEIDTPIASDADAFLQAGKGAEGGRTGIDFDLIDGSNPKETRLPGVYLRLTRINDGAKNTGAGVWLYRQLIDWADRQGLPVYSDFSISPDAQRVYPSLERRGYSVEQINAAARDPDDGSLVNVNFQPIFRISRTGIEEAYSAAPPPREDYRVDGPTLRERQQELEARLKAEEEYHNLSAAEKAERDDPDASMYSGGWRRRGMTMREMMEQARAEAESAKEMRKGSEAAARCAARHGIQQASRASIITAGVIAESTPGAMLGQVLGLSLAVPLGVTLAPVLSRAANPRRYAEGRLAAAAQSLAEAEARRGRMGAEMGARAGLDAPTTYNDMQGEPLWDNVDTSRRAGDQVPPADNSIPMQSQSNANQYHNPERSGVASGLVPSPMADQTPTTFQAPGGTALTPDLKVSIAPASAGTKPRSQQTDAQVLADLFNMPEGDQ